MIDLIWSIIHPQLTYTLEAGMATARDQADSEVGPLCTRSGIYSSMLTNRLDDPQLPELEHVTVGLVLELAQFKDNHIQFSFKDTYQWIKCLFGSKWPDSCPPTSQAVAKSIERLAVRYSKMKKTPKSVSLREDKISEFLRMISYFRCSDSRKVKLFISVQPNHMLRSE